MLHSIMMFEFSQKGVFLMESILLRDLYKDKCALALPLADQEITVSGWVRSVRDSKSLGFIVLHD